MIHAGQSCWQMIGERRDSWLAVEDVAGESTSLELSLAGVAVLRRCCAAMAEGNQKYVRRKSAENRGLIL